MKRNFTLWLFVSLLSALPVAAQTLRVTAGVITSGIVERAPIDAIEAFNTSIDTLYCFTRIEGAEEETFISHTWIYNGSEVSRSELPVRSSYWRTWSSKSIAPEAIGDWQVEIHDAQGALLKTITFTLN
ncbi:MAG: DUF2914 domain-containing protein [Desulfuromonadales bacterium]|nr:DUF2914 domain-containing protein [Desulfuromonadales bacterium]MDT8423299.1 DUF2914 domain-containing protein [Desulfuromonadales bacterium]